MYNTHTTSFFGKFCLFVFLLILDLSILKIYNQKLKWYLYLTWMHLLTEMSCMHTSISWATVSFHYSVLHGGFVMPDDGDNNYMHMHLGEKTHEFWANYSHSCCRLTYWLCIQSRTSYVSGSGLIWKDWIWKHWLHKVRARGVDLCQICEENLIKSENWICVTSTW